MTGDYWIGGAAAEGANPYRVDNRLVATYPQSLLLDIELPPSGCLWRKWLTRRGGTWEFLDQSQRGKKIWLPVPDQSAMRSVK